ncbi:MAG: hypothetical protein ACI8RD_001070, partial [Bacillariaceae sp.]
AEINTTQNVLIYDTYDTYLVMEGRIYDVWLFKAFYVLY